MKGRGELVLTGQLGDVMKESARAAWSYARAHADLLGIQTVIYDDHIWSAGIRSEAGWREYDEPSGPNQPVLEHRDHVHVDVYEGD